MGTLEWRREGLRIRNVGLPEGHGKGPKLETSVSQAPVEIFTMQSLEPSQDGGQGGRGRAGCSVALSHSEGRGSRQGIY